MINNHSCPSHPFHPNLTIRVPHPSLPNIIEIGGENLDIYSKFHTQIGSIHPELLSYIKRNIHKFRQDIVDYHISLLEDDSTRFPSSLLDIIADDFSNLIINCQKNNQSFSLRYFKEILKSDLHGGKIIENMVKHLKYN